MKKLKIFLLLSILLCFGFMLSSEVHAQSNGPKVFEIGDVLPEGQIKISWDFSDKPVASDDEFWIKSDGIFEIKIEEFGNIYLYIMDDDFIFIDYYDGPFTGEKIITLSSPCTITELLYGEDYYEYIDGALFWEVVPTGPKPFEIGDELPAGYIKISWDFTGKPIPDEAVTFMVSSGDDVFNDFIIQIDFNSSSYNHLKIFNGGSVEHFNVDTPGFTIITLTESVTITDLAGTNGITSLDYNVYIGDSLLWEVVSQDYLNGFIEAREIYGFRYMGGPWMSGEAAWNHGYDKGSEEAWDEGFEYGMEIYGYYDSTTDEWLSVDEYVARYGPGTGPTGPTDFYNNFDKYFIPAMIIVFGGAIVLTILKVFKGRE